MYRALRVPFEWLAIGLGWAILPFLSRAGVLRLARLIADCGSAFDARGKAVCRANLRVMFPGRMTPHRERVIIRHAYRNMMRVLLNIFWMSRNTRARMAEQVIFKPGLFEEIKKNIPAVTVSAHVGNWEILSQACVVNGFPMMSVAKEIGSAGMTALLTRARATIGQEIVPVEGAVRPLFRALKTGKSIGLLIDQHTNVWDGGTWVTFFGLSSGISLVPFTLARKCGVPIIFAWSRPLKDGRYRIEPGVILPPDPDAEDAARAQQIATAFERVIRRHPALWCINYRRWRYIRPGDDPARYPSYAKLHKRDRLQAEAN